MPKTLEEGNLRFTFSDDWQVVKLDEHHFFRARLQPLQLTRAVDFLGLYRERDLYFIEAKDFRGSDVALKNREKMCEGDTLRLKMARKVKDSVACVSGAGRVYQEQFWTGCARTLANRHLAVRVVFWFEFDLGRRGHGRDRAWISQELKTRALARQGELRGHLLWLTKDVIVTNQVIGGKAIPGLTVEDIGRAGNR